MLPLLSIITISKDDPEGLKATLASISAQSFADHEVIVVANGTSESVPVEHFGPQFLRQPQLGKGISNAFNAGLAAASGEWIQFLNGGDIFDARTVLADVVKAFRDDLDIVSGFARYSDSRKTIPPFRPTRWRHWLYLSHQASWFRKRLFDEVGGFSEDVKIRMDLEWFYRLPRSAKKLFLDRTLIIYAAGGISSRSVFRSSIEEVLILSKRSTTYMKMAEVLLIRMPVRIIRSWL